MGEGEGAKELPGVLDSPSLPRRHALLPARGPCWSQGVGGDKHWSRAVSFHIPSAMSLNSRGVAFSFLFAAPLILLVFATFLVGGNVQTLVCRSWESGELYEVGLGLIQRRGS